MLMQKNKKYFFVLNSDPDERNQSHFKIEALVSLATLLNFDGKHHSSVPELKYTTTLLFLFLPYYLIKSEMEQKLFFPLIQSSCRA